MDVQNNQTMTDEERLKLAAKLDKELDEFISGLEKRPYTEGWPEDRWEEEMEKHPFFMKKAPEPGAELHPLLEGIQQLKYDPEENTAEELAVSYKDDGNFNFKHKNYRLAILSYTEGLKQKHENIELRATLHNNRAAANFFLKNYRSCLRDCDAALKLNPDYDKVIVRAAECYYSLNNYDNCILYCDKILSRQQTNNDRKLQVLRQQAVNARKISEKDARKRFRDLELSKLEEQKLLREIRTRNLRLDTVGGLTLEMLEPSFPQLVASRVKLDGNGRLVWPVVFLYPEYKITDFMQQFPEDTTMIEKLLELFSETPQWDEHKKYVPVNLNVYFEDPNGLQIYQVDVNQTLQKILQHERYVIRNGTPSFMIFVRESAAEKHYLKNYNK